MRRPLPLGAQRSVADPAARVFKNRARSPLTAGAYAAIHELVAGLRADGSLQKLDRLGLHVQSDAETAVLNLIAPRHDLTLVGVGEIEEDNPQWSAGYGFKGNGADFRLDTGVDPDSAATKFKAYDCFQFIWCASNDASLALDAGVAQGGFTAGIRAISGLIFGGTASAFVSANAFVAPVGWLFGSQNPTSTDPAPTGSGKHYFNTQNRRVWEDTGSWTDRGNAASGTFAATTALTDRFMMADGQDPFPVAIADSAAATAGKEVLLLDYNNKWLVGEVQGVASGIWTVATIGSTKAQPKAGLFPFADASNAVSIANGRGFMAYSRLPGQDDVLVCNDGTMATLVGAAADGSPVGSAYLFGARNLSACSKNRLYADGMGAGLTADQMVSFHSRFATCLDKLGVLNPQDEDSAILGSAWPRSSIDQVHAAFGNDFRVIRQIPPPENDTETNLTFPFYPGTHYATFSIDSAAPEVTTQTQMGVIHMVWGKRRRIVDPDAPGFVPSDLLRPGFPNLLPNWQYRQMSKPLQTNSISVALEYEGTPCWTQYSTLAKADAEVDVQFRWSLGLPDTVPGFTTDPMRMGWLDAARAAGYDDSDVMSFDDALANAGTVFGPVTAYSRFRLRTCLDKIILPQKRLVDCAGGVGMMLDCEMGDDRGQAALRAHLQHLAALCAFHGKEFTVYSNPLNKAGAIRTGFSIENLYLLHQTPNLVLSITAENNGEDLLAFLEEQIDLLRGPNGDQPVDYSKLDLVVQRGTGPKIFQGADIGVLNAMLHRGFRSFNEHRLYGQPSVFKTDPGEVMMAGVLEMT